MELNPNIIIFCDQDDTREVFIETLIENERFELWFAANNDEFQETLIDFKHENNSPALCFLDIDKNRDEIVDIVKEAWKIQKNLEFVIVTDFEKLNWEGPENYFGINDKVNFGKRPLNSIELEQFATSKTYKWSVKRHCEKLLTHLNKKLSVTAEAALESARLKSIGEMASSVAHEINNPLTVIMTSCELTRSIISKVENEEVVAKLSKYNEKMEVMANRITAVIKSMRNMAGRNDGNGPKAIPLRELMEDFQNLCSKKLTNQNISLEVNEPPNDIEILCLKSKIVQLFFNITINSMEALISDTNNQSKEITFDISLNQGNVDFLIRDNGPGISKEALGKEFNAFFSTKTEKSSNGLGLTICKEIVELQEGEIKIGPRSDGEKGTEVIVSIPAYNLNEIAA